MTPLAMTPLAPLPFALPLLVAAVFVAASKLIPRRLADAAATGTALTVAILCAVLWHRAAAAASGPVVYWFGNWWPREDPHFGTIALGVSFVIDPLGAAMATLVALLTVFSLVFSWEYFDSVGTLFHTLILVFLGAMAGFCLTGDLFNLFVFFELMSVSAYALAAHKIEESQALGAAINFGVVNSIGAFFVIIGLGLVYGRTGALNLAQIGQALAGRAPDGLIVLSFTLIACGFLVKAAVVPFHFWLADAHAAAPTPVCVLFSGVMVELGLYAVARVYWTAYAGAFAGHEGVLRDLALTAGVVTAILGGVMCFRQRHLKRLLAFSTISHTGLFLIGAATLNAAALGGVGLYVLGHAFVKGSLFLGAGILIHRFACIDENLLRGRARRLRWSGAVFVIGGLALAGLPPFGTASGKGLIESAAEESGYSWLTVIFILSSALTGGAVLRAAGSVFYGLGDPIDTATRTPTHEVPETLREHGRTPLTMKVAASGLLLLALVVGLWPGLKDGAVGAAERFADQHAYIAGVLHGVSSPQPKGEAPSGVSEWVSAASSVLGAIGLAAVALFHRRVPRGLRAAASRAWAPICDVLHTVHSGKVSDYVAWLVVGVTLAGAVLALATR